MLVDAPFASAADFEAGGVDDEVQRFGVLGGERRDLDTLASPRERGVVGSSELEIEKAEKRSDEAFGLTER